MVGFEEHVLSRPVEVGAPSAPLRERSRQGIAGGYRRNRRCAVLANRCAVVAVAFAATGLDDGGLPAAPEPDIAEPLARFAANLKRARMNAALSQEAVASAADMHRTAISRLETRKRAPEFRTLLRLARALGVTPASLLRGVR